MSSHYGNILVCSDSVLHHTESRLLVTIDTPSSRKKLCSQCLHGEKGFWDGGGKESGLSRLNKEATLTLKCLHPHLTYTVNRGGVK